MQRHPLLTGLFVLASALASAACGAEPSESTEWSAAFQRKGGFGWSGGDGAFSVALPESRTLWLFGDSYLSDVTTSGRTDVTFRFGSTVAVQDNPPDHRPPVAGDLAFDWGPATANGWLPVGWDVMQDPSAPESVATARAANLGLLAWPLHGITVGNDLVQFSWPVSPYSCAGCEAPSVKFHGSVASIVRGVDRPYSEWGVERDQGWDAAHRPEQHFVPFSRASAEIEDKTWLMWGTYLMRDPEDSDAVLVYGHRRESGQNSTVVARVPRAETADDVLDFPRWTFWDGSAWVKDADSAANISEDSATETSIVRVPSEHGGGFAIVESNHWFSTEIKVSVAEKAWGPFTERYVMSLTDLAIAGFDEARDISYAAKAHPDLSTEDALLVSLVIAPRESMNSGTVIEDPRLYVPRFIELPWAAVFAQDARSGGVVRDTVR